MHEENSFASSIQLNVSFTSSIPDELSNIVQTIQSSPQKLFRGPDPTIFEVIAISSIFETDVQSQKQYDGNTGYHIMSTGNLIKGSQLEGTELQFGQSLNARIQLKLSDTSLITQRTFKFTPINFISSILGSVFGLMGIIGGAMSFVEKFVFKLKNREKIQEKRGIAEYLNKQIKYLKERKIFKEIKILPQKRKKFSIRKFLNKYRKKRQGFNTESGSKSPDIYDDCQEPFSPLMVNLRNLKVQYKNNQNQTAQPTPELKLQTQPIQDQLCINFQQNDLISELPTKSNEGKNNKKLDLEKSKK